MNRTTPGLTVADLVWIQRDEFDHYLELARWSQDPADWPAVRRALVQALVAAFGLDEAITLPAARDVAADVLDDVRAACDPAAAWPEFLEQLWGRRHAIRPDLC